MSWKWYGVRTLYRTDAVGSPDETDQDFEPDTISVEERVVLVKARSDDEAIEKAATEARRYAQDVDGGRNKYGQQLRTRFVEWCEPYEIDEELAANAEVFSSTWLETESSNAELIDKYFRRGLRADGPRGEKFSNLEVYEMLAKWESEAEGESD